MSDAATTFVGIPSGSASVPCIHDWEYDEEESKGPWTGYIERCKLCGVLMQVPQ